MELEDVGVEERVEGALGMVLLGSDTWVSSCRVVIILGRMSSSITSKEVFESWDEPRFSPEGYEVAAGGRAVASSAAACFCFAFLDCLDCKKLSQV